MRPWSPMRSACYLLAAASAALQAQSDTGAVAAPPAEALFAAHDVLEFRLVADLRRITRDRSQESEEFPAHVLVPRPDGGADSIEIEVRTRGKFRLDRSNCAFPPLRLDFPGARSAGTVFAGQDKLKLVTYCHDRDQYEQYVLQEYLIYRVFNLLTDVSFRVRLARITYVDQGARDREVTRYGFLIEPDQTMAARNGWEALDVPVVPPDYADQEYLTLVDVFQYLVGNTDWTAFMPEPEKNTCCHNTQPIGTMQGPVLPVPYDFDFTGVVDARYAAPHPDLGIRSVRERLYRGYCRPMEALTPVFDLFNERKEAIYALYRDAVGLDPRQAKRTLDYYDDFYKTINDPRAAQRVFIRTCLRAPRG